MTDETTTIGTQSPNQSPEAPDRRSQLAEAWAATESEAPAPTSQEPTSDDVEVADAQATAQATEPARTIEKPEHLSDEDWAKVKDLPDAARETLLKRLSEFHSGFTRKSEEVAQQRKRLEAFERTLTDLHGAYSPQTDRGQFEQAVVQTLPQLMNYYVSLQKDPIGTLTRLAEAYNVTDKLTENLAGLDTDESARTLRKREAEIADREQQLKAEEVRRQREAAESVIKTFRESKAEDGSLKYPYFDEVESEMARLVSADRTLTLEAAYDKAVKATKFDDLLEKERQKIREQLEAERKAKVKEVRRVAKPAGRSGTPVQNDVPSNRRDALRAVWDQIESQA